MVLQVPVFRPLYGTLGILILVSWLSSITMGAQVIKSNMVQLGADLEEAGRVSGGSWWRIFRGVVARLTAPSMAVVAVIVFAVTIRQVSTIVLLSTGRTRPLSLLQLEYLYGSELGPAAVTGTVIVLLSLAAAGAALFVSWHYSRQPSGAGII
jgi:iron(III) transport system permease protein